MAEVILFLRDEHISSYDELIQKAEDISQRFRNISNEIRACEKRMDEINALRNNIINYVKTRDTYEDYRKHGFSRKYFELHREELTIHKAAKRAFSQAGLQKLPRVKALKDEYSQLLGQKKEAYTYTDDSIYDGITDKIADVDSFHHSYSGRTTEFAAPEVMRRVARPLRAVRVVI